MSLNRIPFQSVNESPIEAIVGIQTRPTWRMVGIPAMARTTHLSRPSNWLMPPRLRFFGGTGFSTGIGEAVATAVSASFGEWEKRPPPYRRRAQTGLLAVDGLSLGLHVFQDSIDR